MEILIFLFSYPRDQKTCFGLMSQVMKAHLLYNILQQDAIGYAILFRKILRIIKIERKRYYSVLQKSKHGLLHTYVVTKFSNANKQRSTVCRALVTFQKNCPKSEVSKMVCYDIVARLDPAQSSFTVAAFSLKTQVFTKELRENDEINADINIL